VILDFQTDFSIAAMKLGATTYPFIAFISLHTRSTRGSSSSRGIAPQLTVLSRHEGSPASATSAETLTQHITSTIIPRTSPFLTRLRTERRNREQERLLREEQDRAFREAERIDGQRVQNRVREEQDKRVKEEQRLQAQRNKQQQEQKQMLWRRWARRHLVPQETPSSTVRLRIALPDGRRVLHSFSPNDSVEALYAFIDSQFIPAEFSPSSDPAQPPEGYVPEWKHFKVVTSYPRTELGFTPGRTIGELSMLKGGASLNVEKVVDESERGSDSEGDDA
jgi:FAS-associated factor 2